VLEAVDKALGRDPDVDVLTFSGSGEPTLYLGLGDLIRRLQSAFSKPVAVLTNASLLYRGEVRRELRRADLVLPSLDAWREDVFHRINRPHPRLRLAEILEGLVRFSKGFDGELWLEILFVRGVNDDPEGLSGLKTWVERIRPDRIQINTVVRPPAEPWVEAVSSERLEEIRKRLGERAEIIAPFRVRTEERLRRQRERQILETVLRRPVCARDLAEAFGMDEEEAHRLLERMALRRGWIRERFQGRWYFRVPDGFEGGGP
jgi:wyosine [tRNA(Phe)-imidazoG37] synthetase (radical SAM superfamily)